MSLKETRQTNEEIFNMIVLNEREFPKDYTYLIDGNQGPTGKSWLVRKLIEKGYRAIDLTHYDFPYMKKEYMKNCNYLNVDGFYQTVWIVLNIPIKKHRYIK